MVAIPPSIPANGSTDVTEDLESFLETLPLGSVVDWPAGANYLVNGTIRLDQVNNQTWNGNKARIFTNDPALALRNRSQIRWFECHDWVIRDMVIEGGNPPAGVDFPFAVDQEAQHCMQFGACTDTLIEGCELHETFGDGIYMTKPDPGLDSPLTERFVVRNNYITGIGRQGITPDGARDILIYQNVIDNIKRTCVDLEPAGVTGAAIDIVIRNNYLGHCVNGPVNATGELGDLTITDNVVDRIGFRFSGKNHAHDEGSRSGKLIFSRNHAYKVKDDVTTTQMIIAGWEEAEIQHNFQQMGGNKQNFHRFIQIGNVGHTLITDNTFVGLQQGRLVLTSDASPFTAERNYYWPLGYATALGGGVPA